MAGLPRGPPRPLVRPHVLRPPRRARRPDRRRTRRVRRRLLGSAVAVLEVFLGAVLSLEAFARRDDAVDRRRLREPADVVAFYAERDCDDAFVRVDWPAGVDGLPGVLPVVPEAVPDSPVPVEDVDVVLDEADDYGLPERAERLLGPFVDSLADEFLDEGHFNQRKVRPRRVTASRFVCGRTTFFENFVCDLCPDYALFEHRTGRELLHREVFDADGRLRALDDTAMPYIAASSGLLFSRAGDVVLPVRGRDVVVQGRMLGESVGGSWDWDVVERDGFAGQVAVELTEERAESATLDPAFHHLGTVRRIDLMGKPDSYLLGFVDGDPAWRATSGEHDHPVVVPVLPEDEVFDDAADVLAHADDVVGAVLGAVADSPYDPSLGLLTWLWLFDAHAERAASEAA